MKHLITFTKRLPILFLTVIIIITTSGCTPDEEPGISYIDWNDKDMRSEQFVNTLLNGDYTIAAEGFDPEMARALGVSGLRRAWLSTVRVAGTFDSVKEIIFSEHEEYEIYDVITQHANRNLNTRVVFSPDGQIAGLFFTYV